MQQEPIVPLPLDAVLYGGDYNPEQWPRDIWDEDMRLMGKANVNIATLPVFGWVTLQPDEETFNFEWLDTILEKLTGSGIRACMATATASVPAWVAEKYPDIRVTDANGVHRPHGNRHSFCPNSENFRRLSTGLVRKIAERYKDHPALQLWHIGNEYGTYCYCKENCAPAFREWLKARYGTLDELNDRWYTSFWGHTFTDWSQIEPAYANGEGAIQALKIDYYRFQSESLLNCYRAEKSVLREVTPNVPITTNLMGAFFPLNYREWAKEMDIVSWDNYPYPNAPPENVAFTHALMRGLKEGQPFLLMEQSPSQQNWQPYNWLKKPGLLRLQSFQAVAQGADSVMFFQWRRGRAGIEKLHGAIVEHHGNPETRVFREVAALGADLKWLGTATLGGRVPAKVAILFDWENWWGLRFSSGPSKDLDYHAECRAAYAALYKLGIPADILAPDADLSGYDLIIAPVLTMVTTKAASAIASRVTEGGATLLATFFSGLVDENDRVHPGGAPGPLRDILGIWVEETDALPSGKTNGLHFAAAWKGIDSGTTYAADLLCDRVRLETATPFAAYTDDFYAGEPALTMNRAGNGRGYYLATRPDTNGLRAILATLCAEKGIVSPLRDGVSPPDGLEVIERISPEGIPLLYLLNHAAAPLEAALPDGTYTDLLTGETVTATVPVGVLGVRVLRKNPVS